VQARAEVPGYGPWSIKAGMQHVEPPFALIEAMRTLRIHFDAVDADNAPLLIAPGSHRVGRIPEAEIDAIAARCGTRACLAERGDIWTYATAILHASAAAAQPRHRRVLQFDCSPDALPTPLKWLGV
jgi:ectoine hydroxylase-related dioxygenase (phytanoyl-CoA dioxygenase family)